MESDLDFINRLAALENCEFGVSEGRAFLQQRRNGGGAVPKLSWRENVKSFKPRMSASQQHDKVKVSSYDPVTRAAVVGEATQPGSIPRPAQEARDKASTFGASELLVSDRVANTADEAKHDRAEHARQARERLVRGRGHDGGEPRRQGGRQAEAGGLRALRRRARPELGHACLRSRRLPHALRDQRPQPAHADRRDAPEGRARLGLRPGDRARHEHPGPRGARARARAVPDARRQHRGHLGARRPARRRPRRRHVLHAPDRRRGRGRLRARRHAAPGGTRVPAQLRRQAAREDARRRRRRLAGDLRPQGRRDQPPEAARDHEQGAPRRSRSSRARTARATASSRPRTSSRSRPGPRSSSRARAR